MHKKRYIFILVLFLFSQYGMAAQEKSTMSTMDILETISVTNLDGSTTTLDDYRDGKPLYLKFWATWCQPCRKQMPHLQKTYEKYGKEVRTIAVNIDVNDSLEEIQKTRKEFALTVPMAIDSTGDLSNAFDLIGTPYHLLIDRKGNIVHKGHNGAGVFDKAIAQLSNDSSQINDGSVLAESSVIEPQKVQKPINIGEGKSVLFFTATWCDDYFKDSRPKMSKNCISAQNQANVLFEENKGFKWTGVLSRFWTGDKELTEYKKKYGIQYPLRIDESNQEFNKYKVKEFPTVIVFNNGEEVFRSSDFSDNKELKKRLIKE